MSLLVIVLDNSSFATIGQNPFELLVPTTNSRILPHIFWVKGKGSVCPHFRIVEVPNHPTHMKVLTPSLIFMLTFNSYPISIHELITSRLELLGEYPLKIFLIVKLCVN